MKIDLKDLVYSGDENTINTILDTYQEMAISETDYLNAREMDIVTLDYRGECHCSLDILWDKQPNNYKLVLNIFVINEEGDVANSKEVALKEILKDGDLEKIMTEFLTITSMDNFENFVQILRNNYSRENIHFYIKNDAGTKYDGSIVRIDIENFMYIYPNNLDLDPTVKIYDLENSEISNHFTDLELKVLCDSAKNNKIEFQINTHTN